MGREGKGWQSRNTRETWGQDCEKSVMENVFDSILKRSPLDNKNKIAFTLILKRKNSNHPPAEQYKLLAGGF